MKKISELQMELATERNLNESCKIKNKVYKKAVCDLKKQIHKSNTGKRSTKANVKKILDLAATEYDFLCKN